MNRNKRGRRRQLARPFAYKQAGAVEEALRRRGVTAHVKPTWSGRSMVVQVLDPGADMGCLDEHAAALAGALNADAVTIISGARDFIVAPEWRDPGDGAETEDPDAWPMADGAERPNHEPLAAEPAPPSAGSADIAEAFIGGYKLGRLAGVLGDLWRYLAIDGPHSDGSFELRLAAHVDGEAVRAQLRTLSTAIAEALGATACRIGGLGRRITITPIMQTEPRASQGA